MQDDSNLGPNPAGLCMCGCGQKTSIATRNRRVDVKGTPIRFVRGHDKRGFVVSPETRAKVSAFHRGRPHPKGADAKLWKGGVKLLRGRRMINVGLDHPMTRTQVYVLEHRLVAFEVLGRVIDDREHVHHIDLDPMNNSPENLSLLSNSQHRKLHHMVRRGVDPLEALKEVGGVRITETTPSPSLRTPDEP